MCESADNPGDCHWCEASSGKSYCEANGTACRSTEPMAQHCGREDGVCRGADRESTSQRRRMEWLALRTGVAAPEEELSHEAAHAWLSERWEHGLRLGPTESARDDEGM